MFRFFTGRLGGCQCISLIFLGGMVKVSVSLGTILSIHMCVNNWRRGEGAGRGTAWGVFPMPEKTFSALNSLWEGAPASSHQPFISSKSSAKHFSCKFLAMCAMVQVIEPCRSIQIDFLLKIFLHEFADSCTGFALCGSFYLPGGPCFITH